MQLTLETFQGNVSFFIKQAKELGEEIEIYKDGEKIAKLVPVDSKEKGQR